MADDLHYPHLVSCQVTIMGEAGSSTRPPVTLPAECLQLANATPRLSSYDYSLGTYGERHEEQMPVPNLVFGWPHILLLPWRRDSCFSSSFIFSERNVLKRLADRDDDQVLVKARNRAELQMASLRKMKSVTGARDDICTSLLEANKYDLKASIEAYYLR